MAASKISQTIKNKIKWEIESNFINSSIQESILKHLLPFRSLLPIKIEEPKNIDLVDFYLPLFKTKVRVIYFLKLRNRFENLTDGIFKYDEEYTFLTIAGGFAAWLSGKTNSFNDIDIYSNQRLKLSWFWTKKDNFQYDFQVYNLDSNLNEYFYFLRQSGIKFPQIIQILTCSITRGGILKEHTDFGFQYNVNLLRTFDLPIACFSFILYKDGYVRHFDFSFTKIENTTFLRQIKYHQTEDRIEKYKKRILPHFETRVPSLLMLCGMKCAEIKKGHINFFEKLDLIIKR